MIRFQASFSVSYILEFGQGYIRFFTNGGPVLESAKNISGVNFGLARLTVTAHGYSTGDWIFISGIVGTLGGLLNGNYYIAQVFDANTIFLNDLNNNLVTFSGLAYTSGGTTQRIYTLLTSPYQASELSQIKFAQNVNTLVLCHPNYPPYLLTLNSATNWTLAAISFGTTISAPTGQAVATTLAAGSVNYAYVITAVDVNGQESAISAFATLGSKTDLRTIAGTNTVSWSTVTGAVSYNVYKSEPSYAGAIPAGSTFGFIGNVTGLSLIDSNITPDFSQGPPIVENPFNGTGVTTVNITAVGSYGSNTPVPAVSFSGGGGSGAAALASLGIISGTISSQNGSFNVGDTASGPNGSLVQITAVTSSGGFNTVTAISIIAAGSLNAGNTPTNPVQFTHVGGGSKLFLNVTWGVVTVGITSPGTSYATPPSVAFSAGGAAATSVLGAPSAGNPTLPGFFQQRLVLAGPVNNPQQFNMSQPGNYYNFNVTNPPAGDNAIQQSIVTGQLNTLQSMISMPSGLVVLSDQQAFVINGGSPGAPISALAIAANSQAYNGASALPPIVANYDVIYVQSKQSIVRDLSYNFYANVYTGANISTLSSHLFYGYTLLEWAWAEEPFKIVWAVRNDGQLLSLTYQKDQEMIAWAHHDTQGAFKSIATVTESIGNGGTVDAVYTVVQRTINGQSLQYIERFQDLFYPSGYKSSWFFDAGIGYNGAAATTFSGAQHLAGMACTGVADGVAISFTMPTSGTFIFGPGGTAGLTSIANASIVSVGLAIVGQVQTLALDLGEPTVQGKRKKITAVTVRNNQSLGLTIGRSFSSQVPMKDLQLGNVGTMTNQVVTDLVVGDARTLIDPLWDVPGQYCIQQTTPYPASILGVIPEIAVGDNAK